MTSMKPGVCELQLNVADLLWLARAHEAARGAQATDAGDLGKVALSELMEFGHVVRQQAAVRDRVVSGLPIPITTRTRRDSRHRGAIPGQRSISRYLRAWR